MASTTKPAKGARRPARVGKRPPKIKADALAEYRASISQTGIMDVITLADDDCPANVRASISTGSVELDILLNGVGWPCGRMAEIVGPEHIGKSTLMDMGFASVQRMGGVGVLAEPEAARDQKYSRALGVDLGKLQYLRFARKEFVLERIFDAILKTADWWRVHQPEVPVLIGLDALGGSATQSEMKSGLAPQTKGKKAKPGEKEEAPQGTKDHPGDAAKFLHKMARQMPSYLAGSKVHVLVANHDYQKIQSGGRRKMGSNNESYGGRAIRHMASIRLQLYSGGEWLRSGDTTIGRVIVAKLNKNRLGNPWGSVRLPLVSGRGVDNLWSVFEGLKGLKIVVKDGSWSVINLDGVELKWQGWHGLAKLCETDPTLFTRMTSVYVARRMADMAVPTAGPAAEDEADDEED
jgi:RecA/RadA recombinase